jgi:hypothetical protein
MILAITTTRSDFVAAPTRPRDRISDPHHLLGCAEMKGRALLMMSILIAACSRSKAPEPSADVAATPSAAASTTAAPLSARTSRPAVAHLVAIGDLHGDLDAARRALRLAGAIDDKDAWVGGTLTIVQTGDEIDRGDDDRKILELFDRLKIDSKKAGGDVIALAGNHELMNASLDFRYVTPGGFASFSDLHLPAAPPTAIHELDSTQWGRAAAFMPGGLYATMIAERPVIVKVGDTVFTHGGVLPKHVSYGLDKINDDTRDWLLGKRAECPKIVSSEDGPVWTRMYSAAPGREECATLDETLKSLDAKRMVVGHTVQRNGVSSACGDHVWRIDTGMSKVFEGKIEVLDIKGDNVTIIREYKPDGG